MLAVSKGLTALLGVAEHLVGLRVCVIVHVEVVVAVAFTIEVPDLMVEIMVVLGW